MNEKLSAFIDNELSELEERQVLNDLERDEALRATWERYHLIRAAMRNELHGSATTNVSAAVASAIAGEPAHRAKASLPVTLAKTLGGFAIAATVAAAAILMLQSPAPAPSELATTNRAPGAIMPVNESNGSAVVNAPASSDALNAYLLEHSEFAPTAGMGNMLPYVRTVNHDNAQSR